MYRIDKYRQGRDYDAKIGIAFSENQSIRLPTKTSDNFDPESKIEKIREKFGIILDESKDPLVKVKVWSKELGGHYSWTANAVQKLAGQNFPEYVPLKLLLSGREGQIIHLQCMGQDFRFLCSQNEVTKNDFENTFKRLPKEIYIIRDREFKKQSFDFAEYITQYGCPNIFESKVEKKISELKKLEKPELITRLIFEEKKLVDHLVFWEGLNQERIKQKTGLKLIAADSSKTAEIHIHPFVLQYCLGSVAEKILTSEMQKDATTEIKKLTLAEDIKLKPLLQYIEYLYTQKIPEDNQIDDWLEFIKLKNYLEIEIAPENNLFYYTCVNSIIENGLDMNSVDLFQFIQDYQADELLDILSDKLESINQNLIKFIEIQTNKSIFTFLEKNPKQTQYILQAIRENLLNQKDPELWLKAYEYAKLHKDEKEEYKSLLDICIWVANREPQILTKFEEQEKNVSDELSVKELKDKIEEVKILNSKSPLIQKYKKALQLN